MTEQELRDGFTKMVGGYGLSNEQINQLETEILALIKKAGYVKRADTKHFKVYPEIEGVDEGTYRQD